jgi:hypothetical protein
MHADDLFNPALDRFRAEDPNNADFKLTRCLVEVKKLPKFDPDMDDVEASAKALAKVDGADNKLAKARGSSMVRPLGRTASKNLANNSAGIQDLFAEHNVLMKTHLTQLRDSKACGRAQQMYHQSMLDTAKFEVSVGNVDRARELYNKAMEFSHDVLNSQTQAGLESSTVPARHPDSLSPEDLACPFGDTGSDSSTSSDSAESLGLDDDVDE